LLAYEMNKGMLTRIRNRGEKLVCCRCGKKINLGDQVVRNQSNTKNFKIYHKECYLEMLI
jgi:hypothetical protein